MEYEDWEISYFMQTRKGIIKMQESFKLPKDYYRELREFWKENGYASGEGNPIYKVRSNHNYVELLMAGGKFLPLEITPSMIIDDARLLFDEEHIVKLTAPDGVEYPYTE